MQTRPSPIRSLADLVPVQSRDIKQMWGSVAGLIKSGLAEGESLTAILERLNIRTCQLWTAYDGKTIVAACVTEIVTIAGRKVCNIISVGGTQMETWQHHMATIEQWARENGCTAMRFPEIRPGWAKVLKDYKMTKINLEKAL